MYIALYTITFIFIQFEIARYKIKCIIHRFTTTQSRFLLHIENFSKKIPQQLSTMLLVISLVLFLSLVLRGRVWSVWSHQKWNPNSEVPLEMTGLHFDLDFVHNFNHENTSFLDQNRCCQSENKKTHSFWIRSEPEHESLCMCVSCFVTCDQILQNR